MDTKPIWQSKTIIGALVSLAATLLQVFGVTLDTATVSGLSDALTAIAASVGVIVTIWGRVRATTTLTIKTPPSSVASALLVCAALALAPVLSACATSHADTPAQTVYAVQTDYTAAQTVAVAYITRADANPDAVAAIRTADAAAYDALTAARDAVRRGDNPAIPAAIQAAKHAVTVLVDVLTQKGILK